MKDKENQLNEIAQDIASNCPDLVENCCGSKACYVCISERLVKEGYRKLPENAFILTDDNAEELANLIITSPQMQSVMSDLIKAWQKETAEKIFEKIFEDFNIDCGTFSLNMARKSYMNAQLEQINLALRKRFSQLAKQFGVEIKGV